LVTPAPPAGVDEAYWRLPDATATELVSRADGGGAASDARVFSIALGGTVSPNTLRGVFYTDGSNLGGTSRQAYVRDRPGFTTTLLNRATGAGGAPGDRFVGSAPAISGD